MFGGNWGQNNQNQQQPQNQAATGFGAFGQPAQPQTNAFGQPQQQQASGSGFGAFGQQPSAFGQPATQQPQNRFGAFGSTSTAPQPTGFGAFGSTTPAATGTTSAFGGTGAFGAQRPASAFGTPASSTSNTGVFGNTATPAPANGTASPAYNAYQEKDTAGATTVTQYFQTITAMPAFRNYSLEELRLQDYAQGRKTANQFGSSTAGFGAATQNPTPSTGFGAFGSTTPAQPQQPTSTGFGAFGSAPSAFGQQPQQQPQQTSAFGTGAFGSTSQPQQSAFGSTPGNTGGGLFGNPPTSTTGTSAFGAGAFGQQNQPQANTSTGGFGAFGQPKPAGTGFGAFGSTTSTTPATTGFGAFGQPQQQQPQQQQPAQTSAFGAQQPATTGFGAFGSGATNAFGQPTQQQTQGGLFGQPQQGQDNKPATSAFGGGFGTGGGLFGQPTQQQQQPQQQTTSLFGQPAQNQQSQPTSGFGFGSTPQQPQTQGTTSAFSGAFDNKPATAPATGGGLFGGFGTQAQQNQPTQMSSGFGAPAASNTQTTSPFGSAWGSNNNNNQQNGSGSLFGAPKPAGASPFGTFGQPATQQPQAQQPALGGSLFGSSLSNNAQQQQQQQQPQSTQPPSLFGGGNSLFGQNKPAFGAPTNVTGSLFGSQNNLFASQGQQPSLTASVDQNVFGSNPLLSKLGPGPHVVHLSELEDKKKPPSLFQYTMRHVPKPQSPNIGRLRGFSTPPQDAQETTSNGAGSSIFRASSIGPSAGRGENLNPFAARPAFGGSLSDALNTSTSGHNSPGINPDAFRPRSSVKKLMMPQRVEADNFASSIRDSADTFRSSSVPPQASAPKVRWNVAAELAAKDAPPASPSTPQRNVTASTSSPRPRPPSLAGTSKTSSSPNAASKHPTHSVEPSSSSPNEPKEGDYWTRPTIAELQKKSFQELSHLPDFTVGRIGIGEITFLKPVNLTSLKVIADIPGGVIEFTDRSCIVYVDETLKPPPGEGLNMPARISLQKCWATDRATRDWLKDESHPRHKKLMRTLQTKENTEFVSYEFETGTWVFTVEHFTRYGIDDSDDDDEAETPREQSPALGLSRTSVSPAAASPRPPSESSSSHGDPLRESELRSPEPPHRRNQGSSAAIDVDSDSNGTEDESDVEPIDQDVASAARPWPSHLGLDPRRVHVMQASLFAEDDVEMEAPPAIGLPSLPSKVPRSSFYETSESKPKADDGRKAFTGETYATYNDRSQAPLHFDEKYAETVIPATKSIVYGQERSHVDAGLALGRSFRVGWGPGGVLAHVGSVCGPGDSKARPAHSPTVTISAVPTLSGDETVERDSALRLLEYQKQQSEIAFDERGHPYAIPSADLRFHHFAQLFSPDDQSHEASAWRLGQALFDEIDLRLRASVSYDVRERIMALRRKQALSDWLQQTVSPSVESALAAEPAARTSRKLFLLLSGNQIERATELALNEGDLNLATLLAQAGGDADFRADVEEQLVRWKDQTIDAHIDESYRRIYALLAGVVDVLPASKSNDPVERAKELLVAEGLDWKRAFGLHLWFASPMDASTSHALIGYKGVDRSVASPPKPWYQEAGTDKRNWKISTAQVENDALFELIKLDAEPATALEHALSPRGFSPSPLDFRLTWHLFILLSRCLRRRDFADRPTVDFSEDSPETPQGASVNASKVTTSFASQLEIQGLWEMAIFVLLHLERSSDRELAIKEMLSRNSMKFTKDVEESLTGSLKIPESWIGEAKATLSQYQGRPFDAYQHYLQARKPQLAHDVAMNDLAQEAILRDDVALLRALFVLFNPNEVRDWSFRGKLYLDYAECVTRIPDLVAASADVIPDAVEAAELERLNRSIPQLIKMLPGNLPDRTNWRHNVCIARMLSKLLALQLPSSSRLQIPTGLVPEATQLQNIQSNALLQFDLALQAVA